MLLTKLQPFFFHRDDSLQLLPLRACLFTTRHHSAPLSGTVGKQMCLCPWPGWCCSWEAYVDWPASCSQYGQLSFTAITPSHSHMLTAWLPLRRFILKSLSLADGPFVPRWESCVPIYCCANLIASYICFYSCPIPYLFFMPCSSFIAVPNCSRLALAPLSLYLKKLK